MSTALVGLIDGTKTAGRVIALQSLLKALGGGTGIKGVNTMTSASVSDYMPGGSSFAGGGYTGNGPRYGGIDGQGGFLQSCTLKKPLLITPPHPPVQGKRRWRCIHEQPRI